jgi:hypothetical protein
MPAGMMLLSMMLWSITRFDIPATFWSRLLTEQPSENNRGNNIFITLKEQ